MKNQPDFELLATTIYAELSRDPKKALKLSKVGILTARRYGVPNSLARMTLCRAHSLRECGHLIDALAEYDHAARIYRDAAQTTESWRTAIGKIDALDSLGRYAQAVRTARAAIRYFKRKKLPDWEAKVYGNLGNVYLHMDRYALARRCYGRASRLLASRKPLDSHIAIFNQANIHLAEENPGTALGLLETCRIFFERQQLTHFLARTHYNFAYAYYLQGKYQDALRHLEQARETFGRIRDTTFLASCYLDEAELLLRLNRTEEAMTAARAALRRFRSLHMRYEVAESESMLGLALLRIGKFKQAVGQLESSDKFFRSKKNFIKSGEIRSHLGFAYLNEGDFKRARRHLREAERIFLRNRLYSRALSVRTKTAGLLMKTQDWKEAEAVLRTSKPWLGRIQLPWLLYSYYLQLGIVQAELNRREARQTLSRAIELTEKIRAQIPAEDLRISYLEDKLEAYDILIECELNRGTNAAVRRAFDLTERARSRVLMDLLEGSLSYTQTGPGLSAMMSAYSSYQNENWAFASGPPKPKAIKREKRILRLLRQSQTAKEPRKTERISVKDLVDCLRPDQAIVSWYILGSRLQAFVVDRSGITVHRDIADEADLWHSFQMLRLHLDHARIDASASPEDCASQLEHLGKRLLSPVLSKMGGIRLLTIIPHGWLHALPFHCLRDSDGYFTDRLGFSYAPSASIYVHRVRKRARGKGVLLAGYADATAPWIDREVEEIHRIFPQAKVFTGDDATVESLQQHAQEPRIIHLATHASFRPDQPYFSGLLFSNGFLTVPQIYQLVLKAELVTLSGCETGAGESSAGDDLLGLVRGFLYAGASSLLVSLWSVHDSSTAFFMKHFYDDLSRGIPRHEAWRQALLKTKKVWPHPYYWGPFILLGKTGQMQSRNHS